MNDPVVDGLNNRKQAVAAKIMELAYQRLLLTKQIESIDKTLDQLEGAQAANDLVQKDIDVRETINQAKASKENKTTEAK